MFVRKTFALTTSANDLPAASSRMARLPNSRRASASTPPLARRPVVGSTPTWPLKKMNPPDRMAGENGQTRRRRGGGKTRPRGGGGVIRSFRLFGGRGSPSYKHPRRSPFDSYNFYRH